MFLNRLLLWPGPVCVFPLEVTARAQFSSLPLLGYPPDEWLFYVNSPRYIHSVIFGDRNVKTIIIRQIKQLLVGTCTPTGRGRIISEKKQTNQRLAWKKKKKTSPEEPR